MQPPGPTRLRRSVERPELDRQMGNLFRSRRLRIFFNVYITLLIERLGLGLEKVKEKVKEKKGWCVPQVLVIDQKRPQGDAIA